MENQGNPDAQHHGDEHNGEVGWRTNVNVWGLIATICIAVAAGSWAISAEVHNYRLQNITTRLGTQEVRFLTFMDSQAQIESLQDRRIDHNDTMLQVVQDIMQDIKEAQAEILRTLRNHSQ